MVGGSRWCTQGAGGRPGVAHPGWAEVHRWSQAQDILVGGSTGHRRYGKGITDPGYRNCRKFRAHECVQGGQRHAEGVGGRRPRTTSVCRGSQIQDTQDVLGGHRPRTHRVCMRVTGPGHTECAHRVCMGVTGPGHTECAGGSVGTQTQNQRNCETNANEKPATPYTSRPAA